MNLNQDQELSANTILSHYRIGLDESLRIDPFPPDLVVDPQDLFRFVEFCHAGVMQRAYTKAEMAARLMPIGANMLELYLSERVK